MTISLNKRNLLIASAAVSATAIGAYIAFSQKKHPELPVAPQVDLDRYLGEWYEIAHMPNRYEKGCQGVKAIYSKNADGSIDVLNVCHKDAVNGETETAKGKARVVDSQTNAKLKVSFFWPFNGDYWILKVGENYEYALVGTPDRKNLWILSRTPQLDKITTTKLLRTADSLGFPTLKLVFTKQEPMRVQTAEPAIYAS